MAEGHSRRPSVSWNEDGPMQLITDPRRRDYEAWTRVTHALGGLFCAGLGPSEDGESVNTFGELFPAHRPESSELPRTGNDASSLSVDTSHFYLPQPNLHLCTENLTPFLSLLPSKGISGLSSLLAQPGLVFGWGFKSEGIEIIMPSYSSREGRWRGWWEGVVDLVPPKGGSRGFSIGSLFRKTLPKAFPVADSTELKVVLPTDEGFRMDSQPTDTEQKWVNGRLRTVVKWDLLQDGMEGKDIRFWWDGEGDFRHRKLKASVEFWQLTCNHSTDIHISASHPFSDCHKSLRIRRHVLNHHQEHWRRDSASGLQRDLAVVGQRVDPRDLCRSERAA